MKPKMPTESQIALNLAVIELKNASSMIAHAIPPLADGDKDAIFTAGLLESVRAFVEALANSLTSNLTEKEGPL